MILRLVCVFFPMVAFVLAQPLGFGQHTALMSVYDGLGSSHVDLGVLLHFQFFFFFFFFFRAGCNETVCPRFNESSNCTGSGLICTDGNVKELCVLASEE
jgi:hypothetical protein